MQQPAGHLHRDPLPGVLRAHVRGGRAGAVADLLGVPGDLDRENRLALDRLADRDDLGQPRVAGGDGGDLVADASGLAVGAVGGPTRRRLLAQHLRRRLAANPLDLQLDALRRQPGSLTLGEHRLHLRGAAVGFLGDVLGVDADLPQLIELFRGDRAGVDLEVVPVARVGLLGVSRSRVQCGDQRRGQGKYERAGPSSGSQLSPLSSPGPQSPQAPLRSMPSRAWIGQWETPLTRSNGVRAWRPGVCPVSGGS